MPKNKKKAVPNLVRRDDELVKMSRENEMLRVELKELKQMVEWTQQMSASDEEEQMSASVIRKTIEKVVFPSGSIVTSDNLEYNFNGNKSNENAEMQLGGSRIDDDRCSGISRQTSEEDNMEENGGGEDRDGDFTEVIKKRNRRMKTKESGEDTNVDEKSNKHRVSEITMNEKANNVSEKCIKYPKKIPPINAFHQNGNDLVRLIKECGKVNNFEVKKINMRKTQIRVENITDYYAVREVLKKAEAPYFSYTPREEKNQTFLLKGLSEGLDTTELLAELREVSPSADLTAVRPFTTRRSILTNRVLPMYVVQISSNGSATDLLKIKYFNHQAVRFEKLRRREAIQCYRCQRYGHSSANCNMQFRCVKCSADHEPGTCGLQKDDAKEKVFCVNCRQYGHPASFRGCAYYEQWKPKTQSRRTNNETERPAATPVQPGVSFAAVTRQNSVKQKDNDMERILNIILDRLGKIEETLADHGSKIARLMGRQT